MGANAYVVEMIELQKKKNDDIIKEILKEEGYNNISGVTADEIDNICKLVSKGNKQDSCYDQLDGTRDSGKSDSITLKYWKAVSKGYKGTIDEFEKRQGFLSNLLGYGLDTANVFTGLIKPKTGSSTTPNTTQQDVKQGLSTGAKVGIGLGIVALIGTVIYFVRKK